MDGPLPVGFEAVGCFRLALSKIGRFRDGLSKRFASKGWKEGVRRGRGALAVSGVGLSAKALGGSTGGGADREAV